MSFDKASQIALRRKVRMLYDLQRLRLQAQGRGLKKGKENPIELSKEDVDILNNRTRELHHQEDLALKDVAEHLKRIGFYTDVLSDKTKYKGIGPAMAGVILSSFDIENEDTPSKMWAFAGLRPMPAFRCKVCHRVVIDPTEGQWVHPKERSKKADGEEGEPKTPKCPKGADFLGPSDVYESGMAQRPIAGQKLAYNKWLRTKLVGVLGPVMLQLGTYRCLHCNGKVQKDKKEPGLFHHVDAVACMNDTLHAEDVIFTDRPPFVKCYTDYKKRKTDAGWGVNDAHRHQAAIRYMIKIMLLQIWTDWRTYEKLPVRGSYQEEKLGHKHSGNGVTTKPVVVDVEIDEVAAELARVQDDVDPTPFNGDGDDADPATDNC